MAKVIITVEDTENGLFEIGIEGLTSEEKPSPAILVGHAVTSMLRKRQKSIHENFIGQILDACQD